MDWLGLVTVTLIGSGKQLEHAAFISPQESLETSPTAINIFVKYLGFHGGWSMCFLIINQRAIFRPIRMFCNIKVGIFMKLLNLLHFRLFSYFGCGAIRKETVAYNLERNVLNVVQVGWNLS